MVLADAGRAASCLLHAGGDELRAIGAGRLRLHGLDGELQKTAAEAPGQWRSRHWVCVAGAMLFVATIFTMRGRWRPLAAKADMEAHHAMVARELAGLRAELERRGSVLHGTGERTQWPSGADVVRASQLPAGIIGGGPQALKPM